MLMRLPLVIKQPIHLVYHTITNAQKNPSGLGIGKRKRVSERETLGHWGLLIVKKIVVLGGNNSKLSCLIMKKRFVEVLAVSPRSGISIFDSLSIFINSLPIPVQVVYSCTFIIA